MTDETKPRSTLAAWPTRLRFQFSLRVFLLAITAFAVGFPIWYRWPYQEVEILPPSIMGMTRKIEDKRITTWQRQWGGGRLKHGPQTRLINGKVFGMTTYRNGRKHGPAVDYVLEAKPDGPRGLFVEMSTEPHHAGQYVDDKKEGAWTEWVDDHRQTVVWHRGEKQ